MAWAVISGNWDILLSSLVSLALGHSSSRQQERLAMLKQAQPLRDLSLNDDGPGRYVFAEGTVSPMKLQTPMTVASWPCVVHRMLIERKSTQWDGFMFWSNRSEVLSDLVQSVPFCLKLLNRKTHVAIPYPPVSTPECFEIDLQLEAVATSFTPHANSSTALALVDLLLVGERPWGTQKTDSILKVDGSLTAIGLLTNEGIVPPKSASSSHSWFNHPYVLTRMTFSHYLEEQKQILTRLRALFYVSLAVVGFILARRLYNRYMRWRILHDGESQWPESVWNYIRSFFPSRRPKNRRLHNAGLNESGAERDALCMVCLASNREYALVPCGHICLCERCLTVPHDDSGSGTGALRFEHCPVCRRNIRSFLRVYYP